VDRHRLAEERSIALHGAVAAKLREDGGLVDRARERVRAWRTDGSVHTHYVAAWDSLLSLPLDVLCAALVDRSEEARGLRQVSPFAGAIDARTRWAIHRRIGATASRGAITPPDQATATPTSEP
jgi:hypothetical protein